MSAAPSAAAKAGPAHRGQAAQTPAPAVQPGADSDTREFAWRDKTLVGLFLDPYIKNTNLEGGYLARSLGAVAPELAASATAAPRAAQDVVREAAHLLQQAAEDGQEGRERFEGGHGFQWAAKLGVRLRKLQPGEFCVQEGGWRSENGGHAILYVFERVEPGWMALTVVNTGCGVHNFHQRSCSGIQDGKMKYRTALRIPLLKDTRVLEAEFLYHLFRIKHVRHHGHGVARLYRVLLPWALDPYANGDCATAAEGDIGHCGGFATIQRSGTCFFKCIAHCFRYLLQRRGVGLEDRKAVMLELRRRMLRRIAADLPEALALRRLEPSESRVVTCAVRQVARKALRERTAGRFSAAQLETVRQEVGAVEHLLEQPRQRHISAGDHFQAEGTWSPFDGFELLNDSFTGLTPSVKDALAGPPQVAEPSTFVDMVGVEDILRGCVREPGSGVSAEHRLNQLTSALKKAEAVANKLEEIADAASKRHILALLEGLLCHSEEGALLNDSDVGLRASGSQKRQLLSTWQELSRHYAAAAFSVPTGRAAVGRRVVAAMVLQEQVDRTLRLCSDGFPDGGAFFEHVAGLQGPVWTGSLLPISESMGFDSPPSYCSFAQLTENLPMTNPALLRTRRRVLQYFGQPPGSLCLSSTEKGEMKFKNSPNFAGLEVVRICTEMVAKARADHKIPQDQVPHLLQSKNINRPFRDFEVASAWVLDDVLAGLFPEWSMSRDVYIISQLLFGFFFKAKAMATTANNDIPALRRGRLVQASHLRLRFQLTLFDVMAGNNDMVKVQVSFGGGAEAPCFCNKAPTALCHPVDLGCPAPTAFFNGARSVEDRNILAADPLPDFGKDMTQRDSEELMLILIAPSVRIPLLLRFLVPDRTALLHNRTLQNVIFEALFTPGVYPQGTATVRQAPCDPLLLGTTCGALAYELEKAPAATVEPFLQILKSLPELSACEVDGPFVQPFLFALRISVLFQGFLLDQRSRLGVGAKARIFDEWLTKLRRFNQAYARSRLVRWLEQAAARADFATAALLHAHVCLTSLPLLQLEVDDVQSLVSSSALFCTWHREEAAADASKVELDADAVDWVSATLQRHRAALLDHLGDERMRARILSFTLAHAMGRGAVGSTELALTWRPVERDVEAFMQVAEGTHHPRQEEDFKLYNVRLQGAKQIVIKFDERSELGVTDAMEIVVGAKVVWAKTRQVEFPGTMGELPLVLTNTDSFVLRYKTMAGAGFACWGFAMTAEAQLPQKAVHDLAATLRNVPAWVCAEYLGACAGDVAGAKRRIEAEGEQWREQERERQSRHGRLGLYEAKAVAGQGRDSSLEWVESAMFNAQTGALFFRSRGGFQPMPDALLTARDFFHVQRLLRFSELGQPNCVVQASQVYRKVVQFSSLGHQFTAEIWEEVPRDPSVFVKRGGSGEWLAEKSGKRAVVNQPVLEGNPPHAAWLGQQWNQLDGDWCTALRQRFQHTAPMVTLFTVPQPIEGEYDPPPSWFNEVGWARSVQETACFVCDARPDVVLLKDTKLPEGWLELRVDPHRSSVTAFVLEEVGRAEHRRAIWSSDTRSTLLARSNRGRGGLRQFPKAIAQCAGDLVEQPTANMSLRLYRDSDVYVPGRLLEGLLPRALLAGSPPPFDFWQHRRGLVGEPRQETSTCLGYRVHVDFREGGSAAIWRTSATNDTVKWFLMNVEDALHGDFSALCRALRSMIPLGEVLIWGSHKESNGEIRPTERLKLELVEIPRLRLRFDPDTQGAGLGVCRLLSREHVGFFLSPMITQPDRCPFALPHEHATLQASSGEEKLLVPTGVMWRPQIYNAPFHGNVYTQRGPGPGEGLHIPGNELNRMFVMYDLRVLRIDLDCSSTLAAMWLCATRLLQRDYLGATKLLTVCSTGQRPGQDELLVWERAIRETSDWAPDAVAVRLRLMLQADEWGGMNSQVTKSQIYNTWGQYLEKLTHISPECKLRWPEECRLAAFLDGSTYQDTLVDELVKARCILLTCSQGVLDSKTKDSASTTVPTGWARTGTWWLNLLKDGIYPTVERGGNLVSMGVRSLGHGKRATLEELVAFLQDTKWMKGPWVTAYAILTDAVDLEFDNVSSLAQRRLVSIALREYLCDNAEDASGVSLEATVVRALAVLCRDTEPGRRGGEEYPPYSEIVATEVESLINVDTDSRRVFFEKFFGVACQSLARSPWVCEPVAENAHLQETLTFHTSDLAFELPRAPSNFSCNWRSLPQRAASTSQQQQQRQQQTQQQQEQATAASRGASPGRASPARGSGVAAAATVVAEGHSLSTADQEAVIRGCPIRIALPGLDDIAEEASWQAPTWRSAVGAPPLPSRSQAAGIEVAALERMRGSWEVHQQEALVQRNRAELTFLRRADLRQAPTAPKIKAVQQAVKALMGDLRVAQASIATHADASMAELQELLNTSSGAVDALTVSAGLRPALPWHWALLVTLGDAESVLRQLGRESDKAEASTQLVMQILVLGGVVHQARRLHRLAERLQRAVGQLCAGGTDAEQLREAESAMESLAGELLASRTFASQHQTSAVWGLDPKLLAFEWIFGKGFLRADQLRIVQSFVDAAKGGVSKVQQMLMGGGKTHVISPLLQLHLCTQGSLVIQVVPESLLAQTMRIMRGLFSQHLSQPVFSLEFSRAKAKHEQVMMRQRRRLEEAVAESAVVCCTGTTVKGALLTFVDALANGTVNSSTLELQRVLCLMRSAVAVLDEVDMLLHPLKSELNFPVGPTMDLDLVPERWELPIHLLEPFCLPPGTSASSAPSVMQMGSSSQANARLQAVLGLVQRGADDMALQFQPHVVLLSVKFYRSYLLVPLRRWLAVWLQSRPECRGYSIADLEALLGGFDRTKMNEIDPKTRKLLVLGYVWIESMLPHCLQKVNRVQYGILLDQDVRRLERNGHQCRGTRMQLAVPFTGKDTPSPASEFSHPEVLIGLTILSVAHTGMRRSDIRAMVLRLRELMLRENVGHVSRRASWRRFQRWLRVSDAQQAEQGQRGSAADESSRTPTPQVPPLHLVQLEGAPLEAVHARLSDVLECQQWYMANLVFPTATRAQHMKLSATASELGGRDLFAVRLGFSGTPAASLPLDLPPVVYAPGVEGYVMKTMTAPEVVSLRRVQRGWTVHSLLREVATSEYHALIDTGALVTGMTNREVAHFLLAEGLRAFDGVVFLAEDDSEVVLTREDIHTIPLAECALPPGKRFTFFDNSHTTGIDIEQAHLAVAALTIGKDVSFRDAQQGAWRMRRLGSGQKLVILLVEELQGVIKSTLADSNAVSGHNVRGDALDLRVIMEFLVENQLRAEKRAASQLATHDLRNAWKTEAIAKLVRDFDVPKFKEGRANELAAGSAVSPLPEVVQEALSCLQESLTFEVPDRLQLEETNTSVDTRLRRLADQLAEQHPPSASTSRTASHVIRCAVERLQPRELAPGAAGGDARRAPPGLQRSTSSHGVEAEVVRESEQEQEKLAEIEQVVTKKIGREMVLQDHSYSLPDAVDSSASTASRWPGVAMHLKERMLLDMLDCDDAPGIRFSLGTCPLKQGSVGVFRPSMLALHIIGRSNTRTLLLSLPEAAAVRRAMEQGIFDAYPAKLVLRVRGPVGERGDVEVGNMCGAMTLAAGQGSLSAEEKATVAEHQALVRFLHGDVWFTKEEQRILQRSVGSRKSRWLQVWTACESWRRSGGVQRWEQTPLLKVLGNSDQIADFVAEDEAVQSAVASLVADAGGAAPELLLHCFQMKLGLVISCHTAPVHQVRDALPNEPGWPALVARASVYNESQATMDLKVLAEEASTVACEIGAGQGDLERLTTKQLMQGEDFIAAASTAPAAVVA